MSFNDLLARLKYKITFLANNGKTEKNDTESTSGNGEQVILDTEILGKALSPVPPNILENNDFY